MVNARGGMTEEPQWYCLRAKPKNEHITSQLLRNDAGMEVFCPFLRFERARQGGRAWVTEAMFPGYLFAKFDHAAQNRLVRATRGVITVVGFGGVPAIVPEEIIHELRNSVRDEETIVIESGVEPGEEVNVIAGPFRGLKALVARVIPARERVALLLEVLGMEREVEVSIKTILPDIPHPMIRSERS